MSKEIHPTQQAYADGVKYGKELCALPWRKPSERPEWNRRILFQWNKMDAHWDTAYRVPYENSDWAVYVYVPAVKGGFHLTEKDILCWCYVDELPLPEWVQK